MSMFSFFKKLEIKKELTFEEREAKKLELMNELLKYAKNPADRNT